MVFGFCVAGCRWFSVSSVQALYRMYAAMHSCLFSSTNRNEFRKPHVFFWCLLCSVRWCFSVSSCRRLSVSSVLLYLAWHGATVWCGRPARNLYATDTMSGLMVFAGSTRFLAPQTRCQGCCVRKHMFFCPTLSGGLHASGRTCLCAALQTRC